MRFNTIQSSAVVFRSIPEYYEKEKSGAKANTVRMLEANSIEELNSKQPTHIIIENTLTGEIFMRRLTDVSFWKDVTIFSWNSNEATK